MPLLEIFRKRYNRLFIVDMTMTDHLGPPSLLRRLAAIFYDSWLVFACLLALSALLIGLRIAVEGLSALPQGSIALSGYWKTLSFSLNVFAVYSFFSYFWLKTGQTLAMQTWRIQLRSSDGKPLNQQQVFIRFLAACLSWALCGAGYFWVLIDKDKKSLHDRLSKTELVLLEKKKK